MTSDLQPSSIAMNRASVLSLGSTIARHIEGALQEAGYRGPTAVVGGFLRDIALLREPKDLDVFLDSGHCPTLNEAKRLAAAVCMKLKGTSEIEQVLPVYGTWAQDIALVVRISIDPEDTLLNWPTDTPIPSGIDLIILLRPELIRAGYEPELTNDAWNQEKFLKAVLSRVDFRINAIGATTLARHVHPQWDFDAFYNRLVVNFTRKDEADRLAKRLKRLLEGKYSGWTIGYEDAKGEVSSRAVPEQADVAAALGDDDPGADGEDEA